MFNPFRKPRPLPTRRDIDKAGFHISRFTQAIEQCQSPAKLKALRANLAYWQAIRALERPE